MRKQSYIAIAIALTCTIGCSDAIRTDTQCDFSPSIYPDYKDVVVPCNIAPLNFYVCDTTVDVAIIASSEDTIYIKSRDNNINIPEDQWHIMASKNAGGDISVTLCKETANGYAAFKPFDIHISTDSIDPVLVYRLIPPGYELWNKMGIYQRDLESFEESCIYENRYGKGNCINCHSFCQGDPNSMMFHLRKRHAGTYIFKDGKAHKFNADMSRQISNPVYPYWHPSGRFIAFSTNKTFQMFHSSDPNTIEVGDYESDLIVYDIETESVITSEKTSSSDAFETYPCFSPDGKDIYFCSAKAVNEVERNYKEAKYSLCRISFDAESKTFGSDVDTLYNATTEGRSATFPRISPDGKHLVFTLSDYGTFSIWHTDADLYSIDLKSGEVAAMTAINSDNVESYHSWCTNSRWMVFSSRRDDGRYTRPYFTHIDQDGKASKPFMLPQKNPMDFYKMQEYSYNVPELVKKTVKLTPYTTTRRLAPIW